MTTERKVRSGHNNASGRFQGIREAVESEAQKEAVEKGRYLGTVRVSIMARDKREARKLLEGVRGFGDVRVESIEGPDEAERVGPAGGE
jgi:hypothetical protein